MRECNSRSVNYEYKITSYIAMYIDLLLSIIAQKLTAA